MIKKTLYFGNPVYLSLKNAQLVIKLPEIVKSESLPETFKQQSEVTKPIEDIGIVSDVLQRLEIETEEAEN